GLGGLANTELAQATAQRARVEAEDARRAALALDLPARAFEDALDVRALHLFQSCFTRQWGRSWLPWSGRKQGGAVEQRPARHDHRAFDHVLELADVARPVVGARPLDETRRDAVEGAAELARGLGREVLHQARNVVAPLAQRRDRDRKDVEPVI